MKWIPDPKGAWRHFSTLALTGGSALATGWEMIPQDIKAALPPSFTSWLLRVIAAVLLWGLLGKFIEQPAKGPK